MNNFKKLSFLILVILMIFAAGYVSAADIEDNDISSEDSLSNDALEECPLEEYSLNDIQESDSLSGDSVEPTLASDEVDRDKLGDGTPRIELEFGSKSSSGVYREDVFTYIYFKVYDAPAENFDVKITLDGLKFKQEEFYEGYSGWYDVNYTFDPSTGVLHFDKLKNQRYTAFGFNVDAQATRVGDASVTVEWNNGSETKQITHIIPIRMSEADLVLYKSVMPFPVWHPPHVHLPNPNGNLQDLELLGQIVPLDDDAYLTDTWPFPKAVGDTLIWYVRVLNNGPDIAFDVNVTDVLPEGVTFESFGAATGSNVNFNYDYNFGDQITYDDKTGTFHIPQLHSTQYADLIIYAKATTTGLKTNVAKVNSSTPDPDNTNNEANSSYRVMDKFDVSINKSAWTDNETMFQNANPSGNHVNYTTPKIKLGDTVFWLIFVNNEGTDMAENVTVKEVLPEGLEVVKAETPTGSYDLNTNVWTIGSLYQYGPAYLIIETKAVKVGNLTNHAVVSTTSNETKLDNNEGNATVIVEGDEPPKNNTTDNTTQVNNTSENKTEVDTPDEGKNSKEKETPEKIHNEEKPQETLNSTKVSENSKPAVSKNIGAATGNPILLALMALLLVGESIFRRKK